MIKKNLIIILISAFFSFSVFSAGTDNSGSTKVNNFTKASNLIKQAKKYESKGKDKKAKKRFEKALKYLLISNKNQINLIHSIILVLPLEKSVILKLQKNII
ncbi:hypothetical protein OAP67_02105 [Candidatus Pelagibacter sp.]|nr:hypothetical protein [Candidatus Pelagibacter sp.]